MTNRPFRISILTASLLLAMDHSSSSLQAAPPPREPDISKAPLFAHGGGDANHYTTYHLSKADSQDATNTVLRICSPKPGQAASFAQKSLLMITNFGKSKYFPTITGEDGLTFGIKDFVSDSVFSLCSLIQDRYPGDIQILFGSFSPHMLDKQWLSQNSVPSQASGEAKSDHGLVAISEVRIGLDKLLTDPKYYGAQLDLYLKEAILPSLTELQTRHWKHETSLAAMVGVANSFGASGMISRLKAAEDKSHSSDEDVIVRRFLRDYANRDAKTDADTALVDKILQIGFKEQPGDVSKLPEPANHSARRVRLLFMNFDVKTELPAADPIGTFNLQPGEELPAHP